MSNRRWLALLGLSVLVALPMTFVATLLLNLKSNRVIHQWEQPDSIDYQSFDPYCVSAIEGQRDWLDIGRAEYKHYLFIGRGTVAPDYGHYVDISFFPGGDDLDAYIARSTVEWTPDGLEFTQPSGHRLFVPKQMYIGGR